jgi:hypothetical protein
LSSERIDEEALPPWPKHTFDLPTRLADGLGLESALIRSAIIAGANLRPVEIFALPFGDAIVSVWFPRYRAWRRGIRLHWYSLYRQSASCSRIGLLPITQLLAGSSITQNEIDATAIDAIGCFTPAAGRAGQK